MLENFKTLKIKNAFSFRNLFENKIFSAKKKKSPKKKFEVESRLSLALLNTVPETSDVS